MKEYHQRTRRCCWSLDCRLYLVPTLCPQAQTLMKLSVRFEQRSGLSQPSRDKTPSLAQVGGSCTTASTSTNERAARWVDPSCAPPISQSPRWRL